MNLVKVCTSCNEEKKGESDFRRQKGTKDGLSYYCKECRKKAGKVRYRENREEIIAKNSEYQEKNADKAYEASKKYKNSPLGKFNRRLNARFTELLGKNRDTFFHLTGLSAAALFEYLGGGADYNENWLVGFKNTPSLEEFKLEPRRWLHWKNLISIEKVNKRQKDVIIS